MKEGKNHLLHILTLVIKGMIIGVGAILPGISGGVLCVAFNIYEPLMELFANPIKGFKKHYKLVLSVGIGIAVGFVGFAGLVNYIMQLNASATVCVFAGLILGTLPQLWKEAKSDKEKRSGGALAAMGISFVLLLAFLLYLQLGTALQITPNLWWYAFCGIVWGLSIVVPGMSSSSTLIFLGLYTPMLEGISRFDFGVLLPLVCGIAVILLLLPRVFNALLKRYRDIVFHAVFGIVLATLIPILPYRFQNGLEVVIDLVCIVGGFFAAFFLNKLFQKWEKKA